MAVKKLVVAGGTRLTITRLWHHPEIHIRVSPEGIQLELPIEDFLEALSHELGWTALVTRKQLTAATEKVIDGIKAESAKVVS